MKKNNHKLSGLLAGGPIADSVAVERMPQLYESNTSPIPTAFEIPINNIDISPFQPRIVFDANQLASLAESIKKGTLIDPITVRTMSEGRYELISGERRYRAYLSLGIPNIPAVIKDIDDKNAAILAIASNTARENLSDYELGKAYQQLLDQEHVRSVSELTEYIGVSQQQIYKCLSYLKLPKKVLAKLNETPAIFGANCAEFFAGYVKKGHEEQIVVAVDMICNGETEQKAMSWIKDQINASPAQGRVIRATPLFIGNTQIGNAYIRNRKIVIECSPDTEPSEILNKILSEYCQEDIRIE